MAKKKRSTKTAKRKTTRKKKRGRPAGSVVGVNPLADVPTRALEAELARRASIAMELASERQDVMRRLDELDSMLAGMPGVKRGRGRPRGSGRKGAGARRGPGRPRGSFNSPSAPTRKKAGRTGRSRPRNQQNLVEALTDLLKGQQYSVKQIVPLVQQHGYKTSSPNFRTIVNQALIREPRFRKVARGVYTVKA